MVWSLLHSDCLCKSEVAWLSPGDFYLLLVVFNFFIFIEGWTGLGEVLSLFSSYSLSVTMTSFWSRLVALSD